MRSTKVLLVLTVALFTSAAIADDDLVILENSYVPNVDVPDNQGTAGVLIEGWWVRAFNHNLAFSNENGIVNTLSQNYDFAGRIAVEYVGPDSFNLIKFDYEHFPESHGDETVTISDTFHGEVESGFRGASVLVEQPLLIGPYWESSFFGGVRFVQIDQRYRAVNLTDAALLNPAESVGNEFEARYDGIGPIVGTRGVLQAYGVGIGASSHITLLLGHTKLNSFYVTATPGNPVYDLIPIDVSEDFSIVPEIHVRGFINYTYNFHNDTDFCVEAGWRANQFYNVRDMNYDARVYSDQIGFAGPYLQFHVDTKL